MEHYKRELCIKRGGGEPCADSKCDKLHLIPSERDFNNFFADTTCCMYGEHCNYKPCTHYHICSLPND